MRMNGHGLSSEIIEMLKEPMELSRVKTRKTSAGGVVPYIDGADAISTANRIFNFDWSSQVNEIKFQPTEERTEVRWNPDTQKREATGEKKITGIYYVTVSVTTHGVSKGDVGRCICDGNNPEAHDMSIAGAVTDGLKRALRQFGDQFGNALYDKESDTFKEAMNGQTPAWGSKPATPKTGVQPAPTSATRPAPASAQSSSANTPNTARPAPAQPATTNIPGAARPTPRVVPERASRTDTVPSSPSEFGEGQPNATPTSRTATPTTRPAPSAPATGGTNRVRPATGRPIGEIINNPRRSNTQLPLDD